MRKRVNPQLNEFQTKMAIGLGHMMGIEPATLVKQGFYELIKNKSEQEKQSILDHYERMTPEERKNPTK